ncbi:MAG: hypothetical protein RSD40_00490 [Bacilli bacterium]
MLTQLSISYFLIHRFCLTSFDIVQYNSIIETNEKRRIQNIEITKFIDEIKKLDTPPIEFDEILFHHLISNIVITKDGYAIFHIKNGTSIRLEI